MTQTPHQPPDMSYWSPERVALWNANQKAKQTASVGQFQIAFDATKRQWSKRPEVKRYRRTMVAVGVAVVVIAAALIWYFWSNRYP